MPSVTLGRKRPSDAIVQDGTKPKKIKFTDDGQAMAVTSSDPAFSSASSSKVKPDYSKLTRKPEKQNKPREQATDNATATARTTLLASEEIDFPRGGGTTLTALELKEARAEGVKDAESQIFKESNESSAATNGSRKRLRDGRVKLSNSKKSKSDKDKDAPRIEYLTYKKLTPGTRILAQVITTTPLSIIVSLPHQLVGHIPIDKITNELNNSMEKLMDQDDQSKDGDESDNSGEDSENGIPDLDDMFHPGQYIRAIVTAVHPHGTTLASSTLAGGSVSTAALGKPKNELDKASRRVELSVLPQQVNKGISRKDLIKGFTLPASITTTEDHGYTLDFGIPDVSGFLSFKDSKKWEDQRHKKKLKAGILVDTIVKKMEENGRMCTVTIGEDIAETELRGLTSITAVPPGALVRPLITGASSSGINVQVLGLLNGTIHPLHMEGDLSRFKIGKKIRARILWDIPGVEPPQFALSTLGHIIGLKQRTLSKSTEDGGAEISSVEEAYPVGTTLENVKVCRVDEDRGLFLEVQPGLEAVVHISDVSDEHVPTLSGTSGPYKIDSRHRARVTGYCQLDGVLQCSMKESVLAQKWLRVSDVTIGEIVKGTIMNLTDRGLFVSISGSVHAVVWPNHFADIRLKHPERKFKVGNSIKCRVLLVDAEKNRISLTAKKSLIESTLPIVSDISDVKVGALAHAAIFKVSERTLSLEFYNGVKGIVPLREATDTAVQSLEGLFNIGQVVKVRIIEIKPDGGLLVGSILKATLTETATTVADIGKIEVGNSVSGTISEVHKENIVLTLQPTGIRALLSLNNLANYREVPVSQLRGSLKTGGTLKDLVVVTKNVNKALVIVAAKPKAKGKLPTADANLKVEDLQIGQKVPGLVVKHTRKGATVKLGKHVFGTLHPTDVSDTYSTSNTLPAADTVIQVVVIGVDVPNRQVALSTRASRINGAEDEDVIDLEIGSLDDLKVGQTVRGFVKSVADSGLFVSLSRSIDARVQIKELFDEFVKEWKPKFEINQVVQGRILGINKDSNQVEMTFRSGDLKRGTASKSLSDFSKGDKVDGTIKRVEEYGVFVQIQNTQTSGLCHKSELADSSGASASEILKSFKEGDKVRALVLSVDREKKRISFGLKPSYFFEEDLQDEDGEEGEENSSEETENEDDQDDDSTNDAQMGEQSEEEDSDSDEEMEFNPTSDLHGKMVTDEMEDSAAAVALELAAPLRWNVNVETDSDDGSEGELSSDEEDAPARKKRKRKHEIQHDLTTDLQNRTPQSSADFERLLLGSPNSSYLWIQFMAFQLQLSEIEKAREVGRRALKAINFREEQERLNVWIALLNLEVTYGTEATLDSVFKEAARANDSKTIHWRLAILLDDSQKHEKAEEQFRKTCKKFGASSKVWTLFAEHYFKRSMPDEARQLLQRSLLSLEKRKHLKTISKFAQLEFRMGDPERGRTIFEGIIETHRKRLDLWNIYIDMEASQGDIQRIRGICERAVALKLSKKKAKFFFKKWLELEKKLGDDAGLDFVKQKAIEWTQNAQNANNGTVTSA